MTTNDTRKKLATALAAGNPADLTGLDTVLDAAGFVPERYDAGPTWSASRSYRISSTLSATINDEDTWTLLAVDPVNGTSYDVTGETGPWYTYLASVLLAVELPVGNEQGVRAHRIETLRRTWRA